MYLLTPYYNQVTKELNSHSMENHVLKQHLEYFYSMQIQKETMEKSFNELKAMENDLMH